MQFVGNYSKYTRLSLLLNKEFSTYYKSLLFYFSQWVSEYELLKMELYGMENYNCYFGINDFLLKVPGIEDKMFVRKKH